MVSYPRFGVRRLPSIAFSDLFSYIERACLRKALASYFQDPTEHSAKSPTGGLGGSNFSISMRVFATAFAYRQRAVHFRHTLDLYSMRGAFLVELPTLVAHD